MEAPMRTLMLGNLMLGATMLLSAPTSADETDLGEYLSWRPLAGAECNGLTAEVRQEPDGNRRAFFFTKDEEVVAVQLEEGTEGEKRAALLISDRSLTELVNSCILKMRQDFDDIVIAFDG